MDRSAGPAVERSDCMIWNVVVVVNTSMSAAASTPVYFAMTGDVTVLEAHLLAGLATASSVTSARPARTRNGRWPWRNLTGWSCRSR